MEEKNPTGVNVFGVILILSSLVHMHKLFVDYDWYVASYGYWPTWLMVLRYCFSWFQRVLGLIAGIGLLRLNDIARQIAICIGWFTMLTIYWKHPYAAFEKHAVYLDQHYGYIFQTLGYPKLSFVPFTLPALIVQYVSDFLFCGAMIYYLTRPTVKAHFKSR